MNFDPNSVAYAKVLSDRYAGRTIERQYNLCALLNTPNNVRFATRYPMSSFTAALNELSRDGKVRKHISENEVPEDRKDVNGSGVALANVLKLEQAQQMLKAAIDDVRQRAEANSQCSKEMEAYMASVGNH